MIDSPITQAIKQICEEKNISYESVVETIEAALAVAYRKDFGEPNQNIVVDFTPESGSARVFDEKTVTEDALKEEYDKEQAELEAQRAATEAAGETEEGSPKQKAEKPVNVAGDEKPKVNETKEEPPKEEEDAEPHWDPKAMISLTDVTATKPDAKIGDVIRTELFPPEAYGRMAAQTAKQVIIQRLREAERETLFREFKDKEGKIIPGTIQRIEGRTVFVDLGSTTAVLPPSEQIRSEHYQPSMRLKFFVLSVESTSKGPEIHISRSHPEMVKQLFAIEVPEIASGVIEIRAVAREGGVRSKIAVASNEANVDPVGSCVGQRGSRVQTVIGELGGEKIDIIDFDEDPVKFIINALSPAKILSVKINDAEKTATAEVKEDQLSLAIGKGGQNVRLAAKLTGWKIDIMREDSDEVVTEGSEGKKKEDVADDSPEEPKDESKAPEADKPEEPAAEEVSETEKTEVQDDATPAPEEESKPESSSDAQPEKAGDAPDESLTAKS